MIPHYNDHAANERTFLSWVRLAISIVGFGLAAARLRGDAIAEWSELALLVSGIVLVIIAYWRMRVLRVRINAQEDLDDSGAGPEFLLLLLIAALFATLITFAIHVT